MSFKKLLLSTLPAVMFFASLNCFAGNDGIILCPSASAIKLAQTTSHSKYFPTTLFLFNGNQSGNWVLVGVPHHNGYLNAETALQSAVAPTTQYAQKPYGCSYTSTAFGGTAAIQWSPASYHTNGSPE